MLLERLNTFIDRVALLDPVGSLSYLSLIERSLGLSEHLCSPNRDRRGERVAILCRPGREFTSAILATWWAGAIAVPLHPEHPEPELDHVISDARCSQIISSPAHLELAQKLARGHELRLLSSAGGGHSTERRATPEADSDALIVYTSGTTGRPKGVVHTHRSLAAQMAGMAEAWAWTAEDRIMCVLPLHHVHGLVNVTLTPLWVGAMCESPGGFDAADVWNRMSSGDLTMFMAVPTVYARLISTWEAADADTRVRWSGGARGLRLMVSGSAALPVSVLDRWKEITGQVLLERYGMTELGMALSNTLDRRTPGHVGWPFPGVDAMIDEEGQLRIRGPQVFDRYWNRPTETASSFVDGWFCTGDIAELDDSGYRLLGRASVDILKTGGEKVSALEIEEVFRTHPAIDDCAVVGIDDTEWGQRVAIAVIAVVAPAVTPPPGSDLSTVADLTLDSLRKWGRHRLSAPKVPSLLLIVDDLPRNAMGKVVKTEVAALFQSADGTGG